VDPTQPNPPKTERSGPNPTKTNPIQPNPWVNPTHGQRWVQAFIARRYISAAGCFWHRLSIPAAAGLLLWAWQTGDIDREPQGRRLAAAAGDCGQCHAVNVRRKLSTDLFGPAVSVNSVH